MMAALDRYATGAWLDRATIRAVAFAMGVATILSIAWLFATSTGTLDAWGRPLGTDFSNVWTAGRMALAGRAQEVYDLATHYREQQGAHGSATVPFYSWHYPPPFLLVAAALATLPYIPALALWQLSTLAAALVVIRRCCPDRDTLLAATGAPGVLVCLGHGNNGFLTAALFGGGLLLLDRRPVLAGICLGLLAYKPQFGLILPVALIAGGYHRATLAAAATVLALVGATTLAFGTDTWTAFLGSADQTRRIVLEAGGPGWHTIQSVFSAVRQVGGGLPLAYGAQAAVTAVSILAVGWLWWSRAAFELRAAALMVAALLSTPYVLDYDMVLLGPALALLVAHGRRTGFLRWEKTLLALAWFAPIGTRPAMLALHLPLGFLVMAALLALALRRARDNTIDQTIDGNAVTEAVDGHGGTDPLQVDGSTVEAPLRGGPQDEDGRDGTNVPSFTRRARALP